MTPEEYFENLPIKTTELIFEEGWNKRIPSWSNIKELLKTWDIDDPKEETEIAQVLRHLKRIIIENKITS